MNVLRGLALQLQHIVYQENQKCWGKPLGSTNLWQEHVETIKRIQRLANQLEIKEVLKIQLTLQTNVLYILDFHLIHLLSTFSSALYIRKLLIESNFKTNYTYTVNMYLYMFTGYISYEIMRINH